MSNIYKAKTKAAEAAFSVGEFEADFSVAEEHDWLASGALELVPRTYRALTDTSVVGVPADGTFEGAYLIEIEAALIQGGHIERVDKPAPKEKEKEGKG
jgi:hypothetical protein